MIGCLCKRNMRPLKTLTKRMKDLFDKIYRDKGPLGKWAAQAEGYFVFPKLEGQISNRAEITIQGETDKENRLEANGKEIKVNEQGKFNDTILLSNGVNTITLSTTKKHGKTTVVTRHVVVKVKELTRANINKDLRIEATAP